MKLQLSGGVFSRVLQFNLEDFMTKEPETSTYQYSSMLVVCFTATFQTKHVTHICKNSAANLC